MNMMPALVFGLRRPFQLFGLMDEGRGDLCCTTVSTDLLTIDLPRHPNHKILADGGESVQFISIFLASGLYCPQAFIYPHTPSAANANRWAVPYTAFMKYSRDWSFSLKVTTAIYWRNTILVYSTILSSILWSNSGS